MTKLLSARDLLEVIRQGEPSEAENIEIIVGPSTLGRRIYNGTMPRRAQRPVQNHPQVPRRRDTVKIESPLSRAQAQALKHGTSAGRGVDERPQVPQRPSSPPVYGSIAADEPTPTPWDPGTAPTLPPGVVPPAPPPVPLAPPSAEDARNAAPEEADTPKSTDGKPAAAASAASRKVPKTAWGRGGEPTPLSKPLMLAAVARVPAPPPAAVPPPPPAPVDPRLALHPAGISLPVPGINAPTPSIAAVQPPQNTVASMFSWVTQRADWAPTQESLSRTQTPVPPSNGAPTAAPALVADEPRSLQSDERIALSGEETVVLLNYDRMLNIESLAERTGLSEFRVSHVVSNLRRRGVIDEDDVHPRDNHATLVDMPMAPSLARPAPAPVLRSPVSASPAPSPQERARVEELDTHPTLLEMDLNELARVQREAEGGDDATYVDDGGPDGLPALLSASPDVRGDIARALDARTPDTTRIDAPISSRPPPASAPAASEDTDSEPSEVIAEDEKVATQNYLAHYERVLAALNADERVKLAQVTSSTVDLHAFAYDKDPDVIRAVWDNVNITHDHARFAAFHHRTANGLEVMVQRAEFFKDLQVQRRILRNPMISEQLLRRMLVPRRLIEIYKTSLDRESAERTRSSARNMLRNKFATTDSDDRMELIWKTEGRALGSLSGLSIDSKTAALICSRQIMSVALVQNFTRFAATPPSVITHFLRQPLVKRQIHLRNALLKHPNCPSDAKRAF